MHLESIDRTRHERHDDSPIAPAIGLTRDEDRRRALEQKVECVLDDCFFTVGQVVGLRAGIDHEAVVWWRDHFRARFLAAMRRHGDRWLEDRQNVTSVGWMLAERAVRYTSGASSIGVEAAMRAAADVERYCARHAKRRASASGVPADSDAAVPLIAGYWCTIVPSAAAAPAKPPRYPASALA